VEQLNDELEKQVKVLMRKCARKYNLSKTFLDKLYSVFPFNKFEYVISHLISEQIISLSQYLDIRNSYLERNKFLYLFEITAPRTFGETWAQRHLNELVQELKRPTKALDKKYSGQYDFWHDGIRIEVKASRAVKRLSGESLIEKALSCNSKEGFDMNFQQIKPACCDVFVFIAVWRDAIKYWVLSSSEIKNNQYFSQGQHRENIGEGQLWIKETNIGKFDEYLSNQREILNKIIEKSKKMLHR
jgi:hypothetical protein